MKLNVDEVPDSLLEGLLHLLGAVTLEHTGETLDVVVTSVTDGHLYYVAAGADGPAVIARAEVLSITPVST